MTTTDKPPVPRVAPPAGGGLTPVCRPPARPPDLRTGAARLRGGRLDEPELPHGQLQLQPPPQIEQAEGASGVLMNAIPMLGSLGSIVLVATMSGSSTGGRQYIAAGMFLFATLGFVVVQIDRQRKQRIQQVTGTRTEYLRYLGNVRQLAREAADQQRRALTWHHPDPAALPAHRRGPHPDLGARQRRPSVPARALRRLPPAALARAAAAGERPHRPGRPGRRLRTAPAARRTPAAAGPAGVGRPARLRPDRGLRPRGAGPLAGPGDDLLRGRVPSARTPRRRRADHRAEPHPLGLGQVAAPRPERPAVRCGRAQADGVHVPGRAGVDAARRPERTAAVRRRGAAGHPAHPARHRRRRAAARQPHRAPGRRARRDRPRPPRALGRARGRDAAAAAVRGCRARRRSLPRAGVAAARRGDPGQGRPLLTGHRRGLRAAAHAAAHRQRCGREHHGGRSR